MRHGLSRSGVCGWNTSTINEKIMHSIHTRIKPSQHFFPQQIPTSYSYSYLLSNWLRGNYPHTTALSHRLLGYSICLAWHLLALGLRDPKARADASAKQIEYPSRRWDSTFTKPTLPIDVSGDGPDMVMISIDHLPSLVAREASESFSKLLLPSLLALDMRDKEGVWVRREGFFTRR